MINVFVMIERFITDHSYEGKANNHVSLSIYRMNSFKSWRTYCLLELLSCMCFNKSVLKTVLSNFYPWTCCFGVCMHIIQCHALLINWYGKQQITILARTGISTCWTGTQSFPAPTSKVNGTHHNSILQCWTRWQKKVYIFPTNLTHPFPLTVWHFQIQQSRR